MRESYQKNRLSLKILWEPGSQVPTEFVALVVWLIILLLMIIYAFLCSPYPWVSLLFTTQLSLSPPQAKSLRGGFKWGWGAYLP